MMTGTALVSFQGRTTCVSLSDILSSLSIAHDAYGQDKVQTQVERSLKDYALSLIEDREGVPQRFLKVKENFQQYNSGLLFLQVSLRGGLLGGKGGFGAALRASGKSGGKPTQNFGACRDLNGRRLRHVNNEIRLRLWRQQQELKRRTLEKGGKFNDDELGKFDKETESGIQGWHLNVPDWAEGLKKLKQRKSNKKSRLCTNWVKAREEGSVPDRAPNWWGCPRGRQCDFAHGEHELSKEGKKELQRQKQDAKREKREAEIQKQVKQMKETQYAMPDAVSAGLRLAAKTAAKRRLQKAKTEVASIQVNNDPKNSINVGADLSAFGIESQSERKKVTKSATSGASQSSSMLIDCICGEVGIGETYEVEGRSSFSTAGAPAAAVSDGDWYYEVELLQIQNVSQDGTVDDAVQVGFGTDLFVPDQSTNDGVGDKPCSWGLDCKRGLVFNQGSETKIDMNGKSVKNGDIVGCRLHLNKTKETDGEIEFSLNGHLVAKTDIKIKAEFAFYYAALSLEDGLSVRVNLGQRPFKFFKALYENKAIKPLVYAAKDFETSSQYSTSSLSTAITSEGGLDKPDAESVSKDPEESKNKKMKPNPEDIKAETKERVPKEANVQEMKPPLEDINLDEVADEKALLELGLERLKFALQTRGLKCGGTLEERATRLFSVKGKKQEDYDPNILAGKKKKKKRRKN